MIAIFLPLSDVAKTNSWQACLAVGVAGQSGTIYDFTVNDIDGRPVSMDKYRGKVVLLVNVASHCALTNTNYKQLNQLYGRYQSSGLEIAAFPCNQFFQEWEEEPAIKQFAARRGVDFDLYEKLDVNRASAHPLFVFLKEARSGPWGNKDITWNFAKFLVNREGVPVARYAPGTPPLALEQDIVRELYN